MPKKSYSKTGTSCRVNFELPSDIKAKKVSLVGEFNEWNPKAHPMKQKKDGSFYVTVYLEAGQSYRYRFLLDGKRWENDWSAEQYLPNDHGTEDSVITT
jgi:1,4-alpha-glucan branching enzyme